MLKAEAYLEYRKLLEEFENQHDDLRITHDALENIFKDIQYDIFRVKPFGIRVAWALGEPDRDDITIKINRELKIVTFTCAKWRNPKYIPESFVFTFQELETWNDIEAAGRRQIEEFEKERTAIEAIQNKKKKQEEAEKELALLRSLLTKYPDFQAR